MNDFIFPCLNTLMCFCKIDVSSGPLEVETFNLMLNYSQLLKAILRTLLGVQT